jgi:probable phosphoglycerate mutase
MPYIEPAPPTNADKGNAMALHGTNGRHRIYLMRHGEVSYFDADGKAVNPLKVTLTDEGQAQARAAGAALAEVPIDRVVCSGLPRTRQTAELATDGSGLDIGDVPGLVEIKGGRFSDIPRDRMEAEIVYGFDAADQPGARFAGGELIADFEQRTVDSLLGLLDQPDWTTMLVVAHDGVNRMLLGWACGAGLKAAPSFEQDMGCLNIIDVDIADGEIIRRMVKAINVTPYNLTKLGLNRTSMEQVMAGFFKKAG